MTTADRFIRADALRRFCTAVLQHAGMVEADAAVVADALTEADLRGVHSHGVLLLPYYYQRLSAGGVNAKAQIKVVREVSTFALLDGDNGMGHVAGVKAMAIVIEKARSNGMATVGVHNTSHYGAGAYYPMLALDHGMVGFATCNTAPSMAPWGGTTPCVGNNPISIAIPAGEELPIVLDIAMSVAAFGKIYLALQKGERIPLGWGLTREGEPTEDPTAVYPKGSLLPFGGHKGYGLAVVMEVLAGVLTGAAFGRDLMLADTPTVPERIGHLYAALDMSAFIPLTEAKRRVDQLVRQIKTSGLAPGAEKIYLPGEIEFETRAHRLQAGIPIKPGVQHDMDRLATQAGITIAWEAV